VKRQNGLIGTNFATCPFETLKNRAASVVCEAPRAHHDKYVHTHGSEARSGTLFAMQQSWLIPAWFPGRRMRTASTASVKGVPHHDDN
jgi:hypothetical protein